MKNKISVSLFILFILGACSSPESPYIRLHIEGMVKDATNGTPIEGAYLELYCDLFKLTLNKTVRTNGAGRYVMIFDTQATKVDWWLIASHKGRRDSKGIQVTDKIQIIDFQI